MEEGMAGSEFHTLWKLVGLRRSQGPHEQDHAKEMMLLLPLKSPPNFQGFQCARNKFPRLKMVMGVTRIENSPNPDLAYLKIFVSLWSEGSPGHRYLLKAMGWVCALLQVPRVPAPSVANGMLCISNTFFKEKYPLKTTIFTSP